MSTADSRTVREVEDEEGHEGEVDLWIVLPMEWGQEPHTGRGKNHVKQRFWLGSLTVETSADGA